MKVVVLGGVFLLAFSASNLRAQAPSPTPTPECPDSVVPKIYELDKKIRVISKPDPIFDNDELRKHPKGVITLRALFCGPIAKVTNIAVIKGMSQKLDEETIKAARKIKFVPAEKNGQKTSQWLYLDYYIRHDDIW